MTLELRAECSGGGCHAKTWEKRDPSWGSAHANALRPDGARATQGTERSLWLEPQK